MRYLFLSVVLLFLSCSIKSPEFTITGQKTNLEQQVLGSYQYLRDEAIVTTSARTPGDNNAAYEQQQAIVQAMKNQRFNKDEIDELKKERVIGENNRGLLEVLSTEKYQSNEKYRSRVDLLVDAENADRRIIYQRVLLMNDVKDDAETNIIFANMQIEQSAFGTMIQQPNGEWIEKKEKDKKKK
jgi:uncharacterized protein YdbL (DUF1318 family)